MTTDPRHCPNHRSRIESSEMIYANKFEYGEPVAMVVTYKCDTCGSTHKVEFKEDKK